MKLQLHDTFVRENEQKKSAWEKKKKRQFNPTHTAKVKAYVTN